MAAVRRGVVVAVGAAALGAGALGGGAAVAAPAGPSVAHTTAAAAAPAAKQGYARCVAGYFCMYSGFNGSGTQCEWKQPRVANTANQCSFIRRGQKTKSVFNRTSHRVQFYTSTNYNRRIGSTPAGRRGSLQGNYQIRSFQPQ